MFLLLLAFLIKCKLTVGTWHITVKQGAAAVFFWLGIP
jgi:hypothetical protein